MASFALCGRNSSNWGVVFLATLTYGAVVVPILHEFTPDQVYNIVNHSEARLLFVGDMVAPTIDPAEMPALEAIVNLPDFSLLPMPVSTLMSSTARSSPNSSARNTFTTTKTKAKNSPSSTTRAERRASRRA